MSAKINYIMAMIKKNFIYLILLSMALSDSYKEPQYNLIKKDGKIEIRQYSEYVIAKTSLNQGDAEQNNNMFRTLAGYIFGGNSNNQSIPMTAPVITQNNDLNYDMIFFMLDVDKPSELPKPNNQNIKLGNYFIRLLKRIAKKKPKLISGPYGVGGMLAFTPYNGNFKSVMDLLYRLFENGLLVFVTGSNITRIRCLLPLGSVTRKDIEEAVEIIDKSLSEKH